MIIMKAIKSVFIIISSFFILTISSFAADLSPAVRAVGDYTVVVSPLYWYTSDGLNCTFTCEVYPEGDYLYYWNGRYSSTDSFVSFSSDHTNNYFTIEYDSSHPYIELQCAVYTSNLGARVISNTVYFEYDSLPIPSPEPNPGPTVDPVNPVPSPTPIPVPTPYPSYNPVPGDPTYGYWDFIRNFFSDIFNFITPWGIAFGAVVVGVFGLPLLVKAIKKFF